MSSPLFSVRNRHVAESGDPPIVNDDDRNVYVGYFKGTSGDQWIFLFDRRTGRAELRGGDIGWDDVREVRDGHADDLRLTLEESAWLQACYYASGAARQATSK